MALPPTIPFWRGEAPARTDELSLHVAELRQRVSDLMPNTAPLPVPANPELRASMAVERKLQHGAERSRRSSRAKLQDRFQVWQCSGRAAL